MIWVYRYDTGRNWIDMTKIDAYIYIPSALHRTVL